MSKTKKIILFTSGVLATLLAVIAVALIYFVNADAYKPRLQTAASEALGMEVSIGGRLGVSLFPGILLKMNDVHIRNKGKDIVAAQQVRIGLEILPLLHDEIRITGITFRNPKVTVELDADGKYNFESQQKDEATLPAVSLNRLSLSDGRLIYTDKQSGVKFNAEDCSLNLRNLLLAGAGSDIMKNISFAGGLRCGKVWTNGYKLSDLKLSANAKNGVFDFKPITVTIFDGRGSGGLRADYSHSRPRYNIRFNLSQFRIEKLVKAKASKIIEGSMDFSMNMALQGRAVPEMKQSASGDIALVGKNLKLNGHDLDLEFNRFESSQNFNLLDMGAFFIAGPVGMAVTKGYDFANVLAGSGGTSAIRTFVSRWKVERGVMHAQDVAMATNKYRMALLGSLDIVHARFIAVTLALINHQGCAEVQQKISGPFEKPTVEQPNILKSVAGPVLKLLKKGRKLLPGGGCKVIYTGTVAPPR